MATPDESERAETIARLEAEEARDPALYSFRLGAQVVLADVFLSVLQVLPWALTIFMAVIVFPHPFFVWTGVATVLFIAWLLRPTFHIAGRKLSRKEAPQLFAAIDALRAKLDVPGRMEVHVDGGFNAGATETRGLLGLVGVRRVLTLGVPLLATLSRDQVLAVIGHELGHFSCRHGRLGHWLYRARVGWLAYASYVDDSDSPFDRAIAWYARQFVSYFGPLGFVHSRRCEYEADADAAATVGSAALAASLTRTAALSRLWAEAFPATLAQSQAETAHAPGDVYERFARAAREWPPAELERWVDDAMKAPPNWHDTHPGLAERLGALNETPRLPTADGGAGAELLGDAWPGLLAEFDGQWQRHEQPAWQIEHLRAKHIAQPLVAAPEKIAAAWPVDRQIARATALRAIKPAAGLTELRSLHARHPVHPGVLLACGVALLDEGDATGVALVERAAGDDPSYRVPAYERLAAYFDARGEAAQAEQWRLHRDRAVDRRGDAVAKFIGQVEDGRHGDDSLAPECRAVLAEAVSLDPCVETAWHVAGEVPLATAQSRKAGQLKVHALFLSVIQQEMERSGVDEEAVAARYQRALAALLPPNEQAIVPTFFSTEHPPVLVRPRPSLTPEAGRLIHF